MAERLRLLDPRDLEALQALYALRCVILHADKDDEAFAGAFYTVLEDAKEGPDAESLYFLFDKALGGLGKGALDLADADGGEARVEDALGDEKLGEEV